MNKINALRLRQSFGQVLEELKSSEEPIVIEKSHKPVAVLLSIKTFEERFIDYRDKEKRDHLLRIARDSASRSKKSSLEVLRDLRYG